MRFDPQEYDIIEITKFNGLYARGIGDECPQDHSQECPNVKFKPGEVSTRDGVKLSQFLGHAITRQFLSTINANLRLLTLDNTGKLYVGTTLLLTIVGMTDFAAINIFDKTIISPSDGSKGIGRLKIWDGTNPVRDLGEDAPSSAGPLVVVNGAAGDIDPGVHTFAVSYITNTGFTSPPGPIVGGVFIPTLYTAPGARAALISNIPIGPSEVVARQIFVSKANEPELFYLAGGLINDNLTTSLGVNFFDTDLVISADELFDILAHLQAGVGLAKYHGSLVVYGGEGNLVRVSDSGSAEKFNNVKGFVQLPDENDGNTVRGSCQLRDVLYFTKFPGILATQDDLSGNPSGWQVIQVDGGVGSYDKGIGTISASQPSLSANELFLISDRSGLFLFDGTVNIPDITYKIHDIWDRITHGSEKNITVQIDPFNKIFYVLIPVDGHTTPNLLLTADFTEGLAPLKIKWSLWAFPFAPQSIALMSLSDADGFDYFLRLGDMAGNLWKIFPGQLTDAGISIDSRWKTSLVTFKDGWLNFFIGLRFRVLGTGELDLDIDARDGIHVQMPLNLGLNLLPGQELTRYINFVDETIAVRVKSNSGTDRFTLQKIQVIGKPRWPARPGTSGSSGPPPPPPPPSQCSCTVPIELTFIADTVIPIPPGNPGDVVIYMINNTGGHQALWAAGFDFEGVPDQPRANGWSAFWFELRSASTARALTHSRL